MKKVIVNADDFGLTRAVNEGIIKAFCKGILTSTSLMATGDSFQHAVQLSKDNPSLDIGVHLTLIEEMPVLSKKEIPTLVDDRGFFQKSAYSFTVNYFKNNILMENVERELTAQIEKILDSGINISHIDSHQHLHILPEILDITLRLADKYGIKYVRFPSERLCVQNLLRLKMFKRIIQQLVINAFCLYSKKKMRRYMVGYFFGFYDGGHLNKSSLRGILEKCTNGVSEIMCHPGISQDGATENRYSHWNYRWSKELLCLLDGNLTKFLDEKELELTSFRGLL